MSIFATYNSSAIGAVHLVSWSLDLAEIQEIEPVYPYQVRPESMDAFEEKLSEIVTAAYTRASTGLASTLPADLDLDTSCFLERSEIFLRLKQPFGFGRGYARFQPFMYQDIEAWRSILGHDWTSILGDIDFLAYANHVYQHDFTREIIEQLLAFADSAENDELKTVIVGDAQEVRQTLAQDILGETTRRDCDSEPGHWICQVCQSTGPHADEFCIACSTLRFDSFVWRCKNSGSKTDRNRHPCMRVMHMLESQFGVPCCSRCGTVREKFTDDRVFRQFSNNHVEPYNERWLQCSLHVR